MAMLLSPVMQATTPPAAPDKSSGGGTPDASFNNVLSHEMTQQQQQQSAKTDAPATNAPAPQTAQGDKAKKSTDPAPTADASSAASPFSAVPAISAEMLAMIGNYQAAQTPPVATNTQTTATAPVASSTAAAPGAANALTSLMLANSATTPAGAERARAPLAMSSLSSTGATNNTGADIAPAQTAAHLPQFTDSMNAAVLGGIGAQPGATQKTDALLTAALPTGAMTVLVPNPATLTGLAQNPAAQTLPGLAPQVGTSAWDQALGDKVVWMAGGAEQTATLSLNPPDLGPLQIVLNVTNNQANATFIAAQPEVRLAIEAAMPKLQEMLGNAGIQLGQTNVRSDTSSSGRQDAQSDTRSLRPLGAVRAASTDNMTNISGKIITGKGLVNTFV